MEMFHSDGDRSLLETCLYCTCMLSVCLCVCLYTLTEFESWYNESFLLPEEVQGVLRAGGTIRPGLVPVEKALALVGTGLLTRVKSPYEDRKPSLYITLNQHLQPKSLILAQPDA